jgi:hypothetical protein
MLGLKSGKRVARIDVPAPLTVHYYFSDHLGSHGAVTDASGSVCEQDIDYYPSMGRGAMITAPHSPRITSSRAKKEMQNPAGQLWGQVLYQQHGPLHDA